MTRRRGTAVLAQALLAVGLLSGAAAVTDKIALTFGPGGSRILIAEVGPGPSDGKLYSSTGTVLPSGIGQTLYTATAGDLAFTAAASYTPYTPAQGTSYLVVTDVSGTTPKIVTKKTAPGLTGQYSGCPFAEKGDIAAAKVGTATYRIYVTIGCTYKCVHQAHGGSAPADTSYIIQYTYNSNTKSFTGPLSTRNAINNAIGVRVTLTDVLQCQAINCASNPANAPKLSRHVAAMRVTGGYLYAVISYDQATKAAQLYRLSGSTRTALGIASGAGCSSIYNATAYVRSSTAFYAACTSADLTNRVEYDAKGGVRETIESSPVGHTHYFGMASSATRFYYIRMLQFPQVATYEIQLVAQEKSGGAPVAALTLPINSLFDYKSNYNDLDIV